MKNYCRHRECRMDTLVDLATINAVKGKPMNDDQLRAKFAELQQKQVRCRHTPRKGPIEVPFA